MKVQNKAKRKKYTHKDITGMLTNRQRAGGAFSYLHPQISPSGQAFQEDDDSLAIVSDAKNRYIKNGWMPNRRVSEGAGTKRDLTALMSMEGALTPAIHNAIQGYDMFDSEAGREHMSKMRALVPEAKALAAPDEDDEKDDMGFAEAHAADMARATRWDNAGIQPDWGLTPTEADAHADYYESGMTTEQLMRIRPHLPGHIARHIARFSSAYRGRVHGALATSAGEAVAEAQATTVPETNPSEPQVIETDEDFHGWYSAVQQIAEKRGYGDTFRSLVPTQPSIRKAKLEPIPEEVGPVEVNDEPPKEGTDVVVEKDSNKVPDISPVAAPKKKTRRTKKAIHRETLDGKGIKWRKSWSAKRLLAEINKNSTIVI